MDNPIPLVLFSPNVYTGGRVASMVECSWAVIKCKANQIELHDESRNEIHSVKLQK